LVHEQTGFNPNNEPEGWDGTFNGRPAADGVYIYIAEITFSDGWTQLYRGDVTIMR